MLMGVLGGERSVGRGERKLELQQKKCLRVLSRLERMSRQIVQLPAAPGQGISLIRGNIVIALFNSPWGKK